LFLHADNRIAKAVLERRSQNNQASTDDLTTADVETKALVTWWLRFYIDWLQCRQGRFDGYGMMG
jgi:hypothetical protein